MNIAQTANRDWLPFRAVNCPSAPNHDSSLQRHHILPRQLLRFDCFRFMFDNIGRERIGFDDFRKNGLLLPANSASAVRIGLPLHRGPHREYNALVIERVGGIEAHWAALRLRMPDRAVSEALGELRSLQNKLRRQLLDPVRRRLRLNRQDPLWGSINYAELDAMAEALWGQTEN